MKRLTLALDALEVETFATDPSVDLRGTVYAKSEDPSDLYSDCGTCDGRCNSQISGPCCTQQGTYGGATCLTTCYQKDCACTRGGTCDYSCGMGITCTAGCPTGMTYPGCGVC
jgi:hypothetical protein